MAQENVEVVLELVDAANRRDRDGFVACLCPEVEWLDTEGFVGLRGVYRSRAEVRDWFEQAVVEPWESLHLEVEEITAATDGRVFLGTLMTGRGRTSGVETEIRVWMLFGFTDGMVARRQLFWTRDEALAAVGLSE